MIDVGLGNGSGGILADDEGDGSMGIDVIGAVLGVVFENEDGGVVPIRAVGDGVDDPTEGEVVIGDRGGGAGVERTSAAGVIVGEIEEDEGGELQIGTFVGQTGAIIGAKFVKELVDPELIGIVGVEIRIERIEVVAQDGFGGLDAIE